MTGIPHAFGVPVTIPAHARLRLAFALPDRFMGTDILERIEPTRFRATLVLPDGREELLAEQVLDPRRRIDDRRWVERSLDLSRFAGATATLRLAQALAEAPDRPGGVFALWGRPLLYDARQAAAKPSLLLITIDALRADRLSVAGHSRPTTPHLDRLAAEGVRYAAAFTSAPMTVPSMPQIFTSSVFPHADSPNLLSSLAAGGVGRTKAIVHNPFLEQWLAIDARDGFDSLSATDSRADRMTRLAIKWLDAHRGERFALYLHYLDTHTPYRVPAPWATMFTDPAYRGPIGARFEDVDGARAGRYDRSDRAQIAALYDGAVRFVDEEIGRLLAHLAADGRLDTTLVVVSADHGEELWDHGEFFHGQSLYDELLHVPLLVRFPGGAHAGRVVTEPVRTLDIVPTIVDVLGLPTFPDFAGESLVPLAAGSEAGPPRVALARAANHRFPVRFAVRTPDYKLIETIDPWGEQLFDLRADPGERRSVLTDPDAATGLAELRPLMERFRRPLQERGYQVRALANDGATHEIWVTVSGADGPPFENPDRVGSAVGDRLTLGPDEREIVWRGRVGPEVKGFRFDRGGFRHTEPGLTFAIRVDGLDVPAADVHLGASGANPSDVPFSYRRTGRVFFTAPQETPSLLALAPPAVPARAGAPVSVFVWCSPESAGGATGATPGDDETRARLRALGYAQ
jgi:arylsulfatase A-like enzyme